MNIYLIRIFKIITLLSLVWQIFIHIVVPDGGKKDHIVENNAIKENKPVSFIHRNSSSSLGLLLPLTPDLDVTFIPEMHIMLVQRESDIQPNLSWTISVEECTLLLNRKASFIVPEILISARRQNTMLYCGRKFTIRKIIPRASFLKPYVAQSADARQVVKRILEFGDELENPLFENEYMNQTELRNDLNSFAVNLHNAYFLCAENNIFLTQSELLKINHTLFNLRHFQIENRLFDYFNTYQLYDYFRHFTYYYEAGEY